MKKIILLFPIILILITTSCNFNCVDPSGSIITDKRDLEEFDGIKIDIPANVKIEIGTESSISIKTNEAYANAISTDIKRGKLSILGDVCKADNSDIQIIIRTTNLDRLRISGSADVYSETPVNTDDLDLQINGSGSISLNVFAKYITSEVNGSGLIDLKGTSQNMNLKINGSGDFKGLGLNTYVSKIKINGSGQASVVAHDKLTANVNGSGEIKYSGNPEISINIKGSGKVNKIN